MRLRRDSRRWTRALVIAIERQWEKSKDLHTRLEVQKVPNLENLVCDRFGGPVFDGQPHGHPPVSEKTLTAFFCLIFDIF